MKNNELGKDYEEWLDEVEKTLPLPIPEDNDGKTIVNTADLAKTEHLRVDERRVSIRQL